MPIFSKQTPPTTHINLHIELDLNQDTDNEDNPTPEFINCCTPLDSPLDFTSQILPQRLDHDKRLSILNLNIRSLKNKAHFDNFAHLLTLLEHQFDILLITETWIDHESECDKIEIPNYNAEFYIREGRGGGIAVYVHHNCKYIRKHDIYVDECESPWIEFDSSNSKGKLTLDAIYRPPNWNVNIFTASL